MNNELIDVNYHPVFQKNVNKLFSQLSKNVEDTSSTILNFLTLIQEGNEQTRSIAYTNRILGKTHPDYQINKSKLPHYIVGCTFQNTTSIEEINIQDYNNVVFLDFDNVKNPNLLKNQLIELDFIIASWLSVGGNGVGAIALTKNINSNMEYYTVYQQISNYIFSKTQTKADKCCSNTNRKIATSFDPALLINYSPIEFDKSLIENLTFEIKNEKKKLESTTTYTINKEFNNDLYNSLSKNIPIRKKYFVTDKDGKPTPFAKLQYNTEFHKLSSHIKPSIIKDFEFKNQTNTLALNKDSYTAIVEYNLNSKTKIKQGTRKKTISAIVQNYIFLNKEIMDLQPTTVHSKIYTLVSFINSNFCYDYSGGMKKGLYQYEIESLTDFIFEKYNTGLCPVFQKRKAFYSKELYKEFLLTGKDKKMFISFYLKEIRLLNKQIRYSKYELLINKYSPVAISNNNLCQIIADAEKLKYRTVRENVYALINKRYPVSGQHITNNKEDNTKISRTQIPFEKRCKINTENQVYKTINQLLTENAKITIKLIAEKSNLSLITVKRYWKKHKQIIKLHNQLIKNSKINQ